MDHHPDDDLSPRLIAPHFRRLVKAGNFGLATHWIRKTPPKRVLRTRDSLDVEFEGGHSVTMRATGAALAFTCTCGAGPKACGHLAAAALAWLERDSPPGGPWGLWRATRFADVKNLVADAGTVETPIIPGETADSATARLLRLEVLRRAQLVPGGPDLGLMRVALEEACTPRSVRDAGSPSTFLKGLNLIFEELLHFSRTGDPEAAVACLEYAIEPFRDLIDLLPADFHSVSVSLVNVLGFHIIACRRAPSDPIRIARWLGVSYPFGGKGIPVRVLKSYQEVLGENGVAEAKRVHAMIRTRTNA
ncbi:MAG: hypothetical protein IT452_07765 [Planctomycetia bacterium]|nr:hypothetical protein [Planctomycetia bacterium]